MKGKVVIASGAVQVEVDETDATVVFRDANGKVILREAGQKMIPVVGIPEESSAFSIVQDFVPGEHEESMVSVSIRMD